MGLPWNLSYFLCLVYMVTKHMKLQHISMYSEMKCNISKLFKKIEKWRNLEFLPSYAGSWLKFELEMDIWCIINIKHVSTSWKVGWHEELLFIASCIIKNEVYFYILFAIDIFINWNDFPHECEWYAYES